MDDEDWVAKYGPWQSLTPADARAFMDGFRGEWWVVGGYAVEAFTGVARPHEDIDVAFFFEDVPKFREFIGDRYHLWSAGSGTLRPLDDHFPDLPPWAGQIWMREHAAAPWLIDFNLQHKEDGLWVSKRDPGHRLPLEEASWRHNDGVRYQNPEIVLLHKALEHRRKDDADLAATWPLLSPGQRGWLDEALARLYPGHPWLSLLA